MSIVRIVFALFLVLQTIAVMAADPVFAPGSVTVEGVPLLHSPQIFVNDLGKYLKSNATQQPPIKINIAAQDLEDADEARTVIQSVYPTKTPAVSIVVGRLANPNARYGIDMVRIGDERTGTLRSSSRVYISGQAEKGSSPREAARNTLASLKKTLEWLGCTTADVVQCKSFLSPINAANDVKQEFELFFGRSQVPPLVFVEWESSLPIEIELIANALPSRDRNPPAIEYLTPTGLSASPVFCRVTRLNAPETIYVSGLYAAKAGSAEEEVESCFTQLKEVLDRSGSNLKHLAKATYYVSSEEASKQLNVLRPKFYDPKRPPAASKATVPGVGMKDRTFTMDMIAVKAR